MLKIVVPIYAPHCGEDDDEYELASEAFDEFLDSSEFDELITEDET